MRYNPAVDHHMANVMVHDKTLGGGECQLAMQDIQQWRSLT